MVTPTIQPGSTPVKPTETQPVTNTKTVFRYVDGSGKELKSSTSTRQDAISG